jgi:uncharacterized protein YegL
MTNQDYTHIIIVLDRSGSMESIRYETEQALNDFVNEQKALPGKATLSYVTFSSRVTPYFSLVGLNEVDTLHLVPQGLTALHDGMGATIVSEGEALSRLPEDERPGKVVFLTITDGFENASAEYTADSVKALIERQRNDYGWEFIFLGANQDAVLTAQKFGISKDASLTYAATAQGVGTSSNLVSNYVATTRSGGVAAFTDADRVAALDADATV